MANLPPGFEIEQQPKIAPTTKLKTATLPPGFDVEQVRSQKSEVENVIDTGIGDSAVMPIADQKPIEKQTTTTGQDIAGGLETAATIASSAIAEPVAGLAGLALAPFVGVDKAVKGIELLRESLTYSPRTDAGKAQAKAIGEAIEPVASAVSKTESALGNAVLDATGSPELAAIAHSLPTAALEILGVKGLKGARLDKVKLSSNVAEAIQQAAPDINKIKTAASNAYRELDDLGIKVRPVVYEKFANKLESKLKKEGLDPTLHPKSNAAIGRIIDDIGTAKTPSELITIRKIAQGAALSIDPSDARLGTIMVKEIDNALDNLSNQVGGKFKEARALSHRAFKSQAITDMIENASHTASGMENGLRIEARKILKNKKKRRGFTADELSALRKIEQGTTAANTAKFLGKFGISEGQATSMLGASIGIGGGGAIGAAFGTGGAAIGALTVPAIGQIAKKTAQRLTLKNTKFADDLIKSGKNAKEVTKAYLKHTPIKDRNINDLTDLLIDTNLDPSSIRGLASSRSAAGKLVSDAAYFANEIKRKSQQAGSAALIAQPKIEDNK